MCVANNNDDGLVEKDSFMFKAANSTPAYAVNAFWTITGLITTYSMFKQNHIEQLIKRPFMWIVVLLKRYSQIMPMYIIVVVYAKYLSRYTGSGPLWDYGTSELAHRRICQRESWLWTILFAANWKSPLNHCIESSWYLANDFQFLIVAPIFLITLRLKPLIGQVFILSCITISYWATAICIYIVDIGDFHHIAQFQPHIFRTYVTYFDASYTQPQYRISAYLFGLLAGYYLHTYEQSKINYLVEKKKSEEGESAQPDWHPLVKMILPPLSIIFIILICTFPFYCKLVPINRLYDRYLTAMFIPTHHNGFSIGVCGIVLLGSTGNGIKTLNNFLSAAIWKPLSRLSLCALLINVEVLHYVTQSRTELMSLQAISYLSLSVLSITLIYVISAVLFVLFEAPIRSLTSRALQIKSKGAEGKATGA